MCRARNKPIHYRYVVNAVHSSPNKMYECVSLFYREYQTFATDHCPSATDLLMWDDVTVLSIAYEDPFVLGKFAQDENVTK